MPDLVADKRHEGRQETQRALKHPDQMMESSAALLTRGAHNVEAQLYGFDVPGAQIAPEELIHQICRFVKAVPGQCGIYVMSCLLEARLDPAIDQRSGVAKLGNTIHQLRQLLLLPCSCLARPVDVYEEEARGVPDLVGKVAIALGAALIKRDVGTWRSHGRERETDRVRTKLLSNVDRIQHIAFRL